MSVVVAIKDGDKVWMACDSQTTAGWSKYTKSHKNNYKIFKPEKEPNTLIGVVGRSKLNNVLSIQESFIDELTNLKNEFNFKYVVEKLTPNIFSIAKKYGLIFKRDKDREEYSLDGSLLFAHKDLLFEIDSDGCVTEIVDFYTIGSGSNLALGYLNQANLEDKKEAIIKAVKSSCQTDLYVNYPIIVTNTLDDEFIIIDKE